MSPAERAQITLGLILAGLEHPGVVVRALPGGLLLTELPAGMRHDLAELLPPWLQEQATVDLLWPAMLDVQRTQGGIARG